MGGGATREDRRHHGYQLTWVFLSLTTWLQSEEDLQSPRGALRVRLCPLFYEPRRREILWIDFPGCAGFLLLNQTAQHPHTARVAAGPHPKVPSGASEANSGLTHSRARVPLKRGPRPGMGFTERSASV